MCVHGHLSDNTFVTMYVTYMYLYVCERVVRMRSVCTYVCMYVCMDAYMCTCTYAGVAEQAWFWPNYFLANVPPPPQKKCSHRTSLLNSHGFTAGDQIQRQRQRQSMPSRRSGPHSGAMQKPLHGASFPTAFHR